MPLIPEEPQIYEKAQGPRATPASGRTAPTPRPVPGPRPVAPPRPGRPGPPRPAPSAQRAQRDAAAKPGPGAVAPKGPQTQVIPAAPEGALDAAEEAVDLLLESGRAPGDVLVITTGTPHPWAAHELSFGDASYWAQHDAGDDVFYADAAVAERAGARPVAVVVLNGGPEAAATALSVARSRAGALLIVCGDPKLIESALGAGV
ncbi:hypothetical protein [Streptomyces sp. TP-A0875]|uniref:hypothetical protein n=1 Tax=Streptomyces sp. TP-A0875 TaxID=552354 RepID=UPI0006B61594|nr:hypothetical protein [Streptomyces sp. TP-A0875]